MHSLVTFLAYAHVVNPPLCTYRLNWAKRTFSGWWDEWDDTALQTQDSKFEGQSGLLTREFRLSNQEALTSEPGPRPSSRKELEKCCVSVVQFIPANTRHWTNVGLMLAHRLWRRPNIDPTLVQCLVFSGIWLLVGLHTVDCTQRIWFIHNMFCQLWAVNCAWVTRTSITFYIINENKKSQHSYIRLVRQLHSVSSFLGAWKDV